MNKMKASTEKRSGRKAPPRRSSTASLLARTNSASEAKHPQLEKSPSTENVGGSTRNDASVETTPPKIEALCPPKTRFSAEDGFRESNRSSSSSRLKSFPAERIRKLDSPPPFSPSPIAALIVQKDPRESGTFHVAPSNGEAHQDCGDAQFTLQREEERQYEQRKQNEANIIQEQVIPHQEIQSREPANLAFKRSFPPRKVSPTGQAHRPFVPSVPHAMPTRTSAWEAASSSAIYNPQLPASFPQSHFDISKASMPIEHQAHSSDNPPSSLGCEKQPVGGRNAALHRRALQERKHAQSLPSLVANAAQAKPWTMQDDWSNAASMNNYVPIGEDRGDLKIHDGVHGQYVPQQNRRSMPPYFQQNVQGMPGAHYDYCAQRQWQVPGQGMTSPQDLATNQLRYFQGVPTCPGQGLFASQNNFGHVANDQWGSDGVVGNDRSNIRIDPKELRVNSDQLKYAMQRQQQSTHQQSSLYDSQNVATVNQHKQCGDSNRGGSLVYQYPRDQQLNVPNARSALHQSHDLQLMNQGYQNGILQNLSISPDMLMRNHHCLVPVAEQYANPGQNISSSQIHQYPISRQQTNLNAQPSIPKPFSSKVEKQIDHNENSNNSPFTPKVIDNSHLPTMKYGGSQFYSPSQINQNPTVHRPANPNQQTAQQNPLTIPVKTRDVEKPRNLQFTPDMIRDQEFLVSTMRQQNIPDDIMRRQFDALLCEQRRHLAYLEQLRSQEETREAKKSPTVSRKRERQDEKPEWMIHITPPRISYEEMLRSRMQDELQREEGGPGEGVSKDQRVSAEQQVTVQRGPKEMLNEDAAPQQIHCRDQQADTWGHANNWQELGNRRRANDWQQAGNWHQPSNFQQAKSFEEGKNPQQGGNFQGVEVQQEAGNWHQVAALRAAGNPWQACNWQKNNQNARFSTTGMNLSPWHQASPTWGNKFNGTACDPSFMAQHQQHCQCQSQSPGYSQQYWNPQTQQQDISKETSNSNSSKNTENREKFNCESASLLKMRIYREVIRPQKRNNGLQDPETVQRALATLKDAQSRRGFEYLANLTKRKPVAKLNGIQELEEAYFEQQRPVLQAPKKISSNGLENSRNPNNPPVRRLSLVKKPAKEVLHEYPRQRNTMNPRNCYSLQAERENGTVATGARQSELEQAQFQNERNLTSMQNTVVPTTKFDARYPQFCRQQCCLKRQKLSNDQSIGQQNLGVINGEGDVGSASLQNAINSKNGNGAAGDAVGTSKCGNEIPDAMQSKLLSNACCNHDQPGIQESKTIGGVTYLARKPNCIPNPQTISANALYGNRQLQPPIIC